MRSFRRYEEVCCYEEVRRYEEVQGLMKYELRGR